MSSHDKPKIKIIYQFPGQGSQEVGMLSHFSKWYTGQNKNYAEHFFKTLASSLPSQYLNAEQLWQYVEQGPTTELLLTYHAQPSILMTSALYWDWWQTHALPLLQNFFDVEAAAVLGHSLGEYSALCASGALNWSETVSLTYYRGRAMQEASPLGEGGMWAILKLPLPVIQQGIDWICSQGHELFIANYNTPEQHVLAGKKSAITPFQDWVKENHQGLWRCVELPVSAPFHSPLLSRATDILQPHLCALTYNSPQCSYVANVDGRTYTPEESTPEAICQRLSEQLTAPVRWYLGLQQLAQQTPFDLTIEVGHGSVLTGMVNKILSQGTMACATYDWVKLGPEQLNAQIQNLAERLLAHQKSSSL